MEKSYSESSQEVISVRLVGDELFQFYKLKEKFEETAGMELTKTQVLKHIIKSDYNTRFQR